MHSHLKNLFEMTEFCNLSLILFDKNERIIYASKNACELLNANYTQLEQQSIRAFFSPQSEINNVVTSTHMKDFLGENLVISYLLHHFDLGDETNYIVILGDEAFFFKNTALNLTARITELQSFALSLCSKNDPSNLSQLQNFSFDNANTIERYFNNNCFELFLQPIVNEFGVVIKFEVLTRLVLAGKIYGPGIFLPFIQRHGFIERLDEYVLGKTLELLSGSFWRAEIERCHYCFAINISPSSNNFYQHVQNLLDLVKKSNLGFNSTCLEFEITEGVLVQNEVQDERVLMQVAQLLHDNNIMLSMDDFGVKNSSFGRLIACDFDSIKIDMHVVSQLINEGYSCKSAKIIMRSLVGLSADLELKLIVEGVESRELYLILHELGCKIFQGYYFFRPLPIKEVEDLILENKLDQLDKVMS